MSDPIYNTAGQLVTTIADGMVDNSTSLVLIGKNYAGYGHFLNENYLYLLENFANATAPANPQAGQLWYDNFNNIIKFYNGTQWKPVSTSAASATAPTSPVTGDLWWDTVNAQLKVWSGTAWITVGPTYTAASGTSGAIVSSILDATGKSHLVIEFYISNTVYAILSQDQQFTPQTAIPGFTTVNPGFNLISSSTLTNSQFTGVISNSLTLSGISAAQFLRSDQNTSTPYILTAGGGLYVGSDLNVNPNPATNEVQLNTIQKNRNLNIYVNSTTTGNILAIGIFGANGAVTTSNALSTGGAFTANGAATFLNTVTFQNNASPSTNGTINLGSVTNNYGNVYAINFVGNTTPTVLLAGGSTGLNGQLLQSTGTGITWANVNATTLGLGTQANVQHYSFSVGNTAASGLLGEIRATNNITAYYSSDARLKENVVNIPDALTKLQQINGVSYDWSDSYIQAHGGEDGFFVRKHDVGLIAQEVESILPEIVATTADGYKAIKYERVVALLVEAVKELREEVNNLKNR
jgi:hypothetical protein